METIVLGKDIKVFYITASSFRLGIGAAHEKLHALVPSSAGRRFFGISRPENGHIVYKAAAEEMEEGEAEKLNCDTLVLEKGKYISLTLHDYLKDLQSIGNAFKQLLSCPGLDPQGYCVECYLNDKDMRCMVRLKD
jgi:hypothetical protein